MTIVILAEKREQGEKIAAGLGLNQREGHTLIGSHNNQKTIVCWAAGHLVQPIDPEEANPNANWIEPESLLPIPVPGKLKPSDRGKSMLGGLKAVISKASEVWIATDPDREGEGIGRNILLYAGYKGNVKRLWLVGSLEPSEIKKAANTILDGNKKLPLFRAQQARQGADWLWQFLVRAYTMKGRGGLMGENLGTGKGAASVVSVGRVQTPTLKMVVDRDTAIANFKPILHYTTAPIAAGIPWNYITPSDEFLVGQAKNIQFDDAGDIFFINKADVTGFSNRLIGSTMTVLKATKGDKSVSPPLPHSLTSLQRTMSKLLGMSSKKTLEIADAIRLDGYLTYPRTEHGELPMSLYNKDDLTAQLNACMAVPEIKSSAIAMLSKHPEDPAPKCYTNKPMEHHGIIPTGKIPDLSKWPKDRVMVFTVCAKAFVTALHPPAQYKVLSIEGEVAVNGLLGEKPSHFKKTSSQLVSAGWKALGDSEDDGDAVTSLPDIKQGQQLNITASPIFEKKTTPPKPYTEDTLLAAMLYAGREVGGEDGRLLNEVSGIGTPATRAAIIETLELREYISLKKTKAATVITSTAKGADLIKAIDAELSSVVMTALWERQLKEIEGAKDDTEAIEKRNAFMREQVAFATKHIEQIVAIMKSTPTKHRGNNMSKPTEGMIKFAKAIAEQCKIELGNALNDFDSCKAFIDKNKDSLPPKTGGSDGKPTEKMVAFARKLSGEKQLELKDDVLLSFKKCKAFIDEALKMQ